MAFLMAPLRPLADLIDLSVEALAAVGTVSAGALAGLLERPTGVRPVAALPAGA